MKIAATSDLHGHLPEVPRCDVLIVAGDLGPASQTYHFDQEARRGWLINEFSPWCQSQSAGDVVVIGGNHDFALADDGYPCIKHLPRVHYLQDSAVTIKGVKFYGSPWTPPFFTLAFMESEEELAKRWEAIPDDVDVLITHGPPHGIGDQNRQGEHCGSRSLREWRDTTRNLPRLHVWGHIHEARGQHGENWANVSLLDERYRPRGRILMTEVQQRRYATRGENRPNP